MKRLFTILLALMLVVGLTLPAAAGKIPFFGSKQPGGILIFADQRQTTGSIWFVDDSGTDGSGYGRSPSSPLDTIDYAIGLCTAGAGDIIYVMPGHAETVTSAITMDVAGVSIIGLGHGRYRPTVTGNGTIDAITITAAGCRVENIRFAAPATDAQTADINIAAANVTIKDTVHIGSTTDKNKVDIITLPTAADDAVLDGVQIFNSVVEVVGGIVFEGACSRVEIKDVVVQDSIGFTNGAISDEVTALQVYIHDSIFSNAKADTVTAEFGNNTTGVMRDCFINGRHTTIASNLSEGTGMAFYEVYVVEEAAKNGLLEPGVDAE